MTEDWDYAALLDRFLRAGYTDIAFGALIPGSGGQLLLRHDIDFDCGSALKIAAVEARAGVRSTFFFLLSSPGYNLLAPENRDRVAEIAGLGHRIALHFDPTAYADYQAGLATELSVFAAAFGVRPDIISLHRPAADFLAGDRPIVGVEHTYLAKYFRDIHYVSDSTGAWRYGHPAASEAFARRSSIHLLTHPIWWTEPGPLATAKLRHFFARRREELIATYTANCQPFQTIAGELR